MILIQLVRCGYNIVHDDGFTIDRAYGSGDYLFLLFRSRVKIRTDDVVEADRNTCIIYRKGSRQWYQAIEHPMVHDWFHFDGPEVEELFARLGLPFDTLIHVHESFYVSKKISELQETLIQNGRHRDELLDAIIRCLFMQLADMQYRFRENNHISKYYEQFVALRNEIYHYPYVFYTVDELAEKVNLSRSYFQKLYKDIFGVSVISDMIRNRLDYAMYLLSNTSYSIKDVSDRCGYANDVHFMRQFKKFVGLSPSEYRYSHRAGEQTGRLAGSVRQS